VGTVSGHSSVLLLTDNFFFQKLVYQRIRRYLGMENVVLEGKAELEEEEDGEAAGEE
jgi:hypothetical protein